MFLQVLLCDWSGERSLYVHCTISDYWKFCEILQKYQYRVSLPTMLSITSPVLEFLRTCHLYCLWEWRASLFSVYCTRSKHYHPAIDMLVFCQVEFSQLLARKGIKSILSTVGSLCRCLCNFRLSDSLTPLKDQWRHVWTLKVNVVGLPSLKWKDRWWLLMEHNDGLLTQLVKPSTTFTWKTRRFNTPHSEKTCWLFYFHLILRHIHPDERLNTRAIL